MTSSAVFEMRGPSVRFLRRTAWESGVNSRSAAEGLLVKFLAANPKPPRKAYTKKVKGGPAHV